MQVVHLLKEIDKDAPTEFQVLPFGRVELEGEPDAYVDEDTARAILADFERRGNDMVIDYEHQTLMDVQAPAAGWIKKLVDKGKEGLWVAVEWTAQARKYINNREYRYFSPVMWLEKGSRRVAGLKNVALTNDPKINNLKPIISKLNEQSTQKEGEEMLKKILKALGLADDAGEDKAVEMVESLVAKDKELETKTEVSACKEVLEALKLKEGVDAEAVIAKIDELSAPAGSAIELSKQVAQLTIQINDIKRDDLVELALKEGKTSPDEVKKWGLDLAAKNPAMFEQVVLSRPEGSVMPVNGLPKGAPKKGEAIEEVTLTVAKLMGNTEADIKKYSA